MAEEKKQRQPNLDAIELPIVDISAFIDIKSSTDKDRQEIINKIEYGFSNIGFILLKGHNLDNKLLSSTFDTNKKFFTSIPKDLLSSTIIQSPVPRGYASIDTENFGALIGQMKPNDLNCKYRIGPETHKNIKIKVHKNNKQIKSNYNNDKDNKQNDDSLDNQLLDEYYGTKGARCLLYPNIWPFVDIQTDNYKNEMVIMNDFKLCLLKIYDELYKIAQILFDIFETIFVDKLEHKKLNFNKELFDKHTSILSSNYYPNKSEIKMKYNLDIDDKDINKKRLAISEHADIDIFTIIIQNNNEGGVQIKLNDKWLSIPYDTDANYLIVNIGDGFEYLTNNKWKSTKHRVKIPENDKSRQVMAFFAALNYDAMMKPLIQRTDKSNVSDVEYDYNDIVTYYEWRKKRIKRVVKQLKKIAQNT
eukprot:294808_1